MCKKHAHLDRPNSGRPLIKTLCVKGIFMESNNNDLKTLDKEMLIINIIGFPGAILLGLGLFGLFDEDPSGLHNIFSYPEFIYLLLKVNLKYS